MQGMRTPLLLSLLLVAPVATLGGCKAKPAADGRKPIKRPDEPRALQYHLEDHLLPAAKAGDQAKVRAALEGFLATEADFAAVFGAEGPALFAAYRERITPKFLAEAPAVIIARVKENYTEIKVHQVGPALPKYTVPGDQLTLDTMVTKQALMSVWLRPPGEPLGLRLEGWMHRDGRWLTVLKLHREIARLAEAADAAAKAAKPAEAPASEGASPPE